MKNLTSKDFFKMFSEAKTKEERIAIRIAAHESLDLENEIDFLTMCIDSLIDQQSNIKPY